MQEPIGVTDIVPDGQMPQPVYQSDTGVKTFAADGPYLLLDGRSLQAPMPVVDAGGPIWQAPNGSAFSALAVTHLPSGDGPGPAPYIPNLHDFWSNDKALAEFATRFTITGPNLVLEMCFLFEGAPQFTIHHGADTLQIADIVLNADAGFGCLVAIASGVASEVAQLRVEATGGTFGGVFGRIRELDYAPAVAWSEGVAGNDRLTHLMQSPVTGEMVGVSIWHRGYTDSGKFTDLELITRTQIIDGVPIPYTTSPIGPNWEEIDPGVYAINTSYPHGSNSTLFNFTFDTPVPAPIYWDFGVTVDPGTVTYTGIGDVTTNNNWTSGTVIGANVTQEQSRYNTTYTGATLNARGNCRVGSFKFYSNPTPYGCSIYRKADQLETTFRNSTGEPWAALAVCLRKVGDWLPFTMTAGDTGDWLGYTSGNIAYPPFNPAQGNISNQPFAANALEALYSDGGELVAIFHGELPVRLGVQINTYHGQQNFSQQVGGNTVVRFAPPINFVAGQTYGVVFTPLEN